MNYSHHTYIITPIDTIMNSSQIITSGCYNFAHKYSYAHARYTIQTILNFKSRIEKCNITISKLCMDEEIHVITSGSLFDRCQPLYVNNKIIFTMLRLFISDDWTEVINVIDKQALLISFLAHHNNIKAGRLTLHIDIMNDHRTHHTVLGKTCTIEIINRRAHIEDYTKEDFVIIKN